MRGYLTAAYSHEVYLEQAITMLLSFRSKNDLTPFSIVVDEENYKRILVRNYKEWFDQIIILDQSKLYDFIGKLYSALQTPYTDTIYFDSDCLLIKSADLLNRELSIYNFCVPGADVYDGEYAGIQMKEWLAYNQLKYIPIFNAGVFRFNENGKPIIEEALAMMHEPEKYHLPAADGGLNEQVALGIAMAKHDIHPIAFAHDLHFSFYNANTPLQLDIAQSICNFTKEQIPRSPFIFHYTPLYHAGFYYSASRRLLMKEINKLRGHFGIAATEFFKPTLRDKLALLRRGKLWRDVR
jgi:hypothetical protein